MDVFLKIVYKSIYNSLHTLKSPFFYIVLAIAFFQYKKLGKIERVVLEGQNKPTLYNLFISTIFGLIAGIVASTILLYLNITIDLKNFYYILPISLILFIINPRYMCFSYSGGIISLISLIFGYPKIQVSEIMILVGVLHLIESLLIVVDSRNGYMPIYIEKEGEVIGGFTMNRFWPVPFLIFTYGNLLYPVTIMSILGYGDMALTSYPEDKSKGTAYMLAIFSLTLTLLALKSTRNYNFKYLAAMFAPLGHELIILIGKSKEEKGNYIYAPVNFGLKILYVLPNGIGENIGLNSGDILISINGYRVYNEGDLNNILKSKSSSIKLEYIDRKNRLKIKEYKNNKIKIKDLGILSISNKPDYSLVMEETNKPFTRFIENYKKRKARFRN